MSSIFSSSSRTHRSRPALYSRPSASRSAPSIFGIPGSGSHRSHSPTKSSSRGFFGLGSSSSKHHSSTSSYKRRPREGYVAYLVHKLKRLLSDLWRFFRRHPLKAFLTIVVPLLSAGGAVGALLRAAGVSVPLLSAFGSRSRGSGGGYYGSDGYGADGGGGDVLGSLGQVMKLAQAFV